MAEYLTGISHEGPEAFGLEDYPTTLDYGRLRFASTWIDLAEGIRYASGPVIRDLKEILSGDHGFRRESAMTPERWLAQCEVSAGAFASRRDLVDAFRRDCPDTAIGQRAFLALAREILGRDGRFSPDGARGPWGFKARLPR
ncbi:hypothetical protein HEP87_29660 [Streptomyces sp. S1D4-11]|nr:hypothetical protein [Streptomyces sp. S1D4-11]QIY97387.1 hypothetical protein HEP87_29660 [Streptomyces sp. S1D4-11]